jgi:hypothetical protein
MFVFFVLLGITFPSIRDAFDTVLENQIVQDYPFQDKCTAIAVARGATTDGSTMTTHTADCAECDWRVNKVDAADWPLGSMRPIYLITGAYPRQVREDRGWTWHPNNLENLPQRGVWEKMRGPIIGSIPQVISNR